MKLVNRAKMTITAVASSGTGALTLGAASSGFQTFADAGVSNGETVRYTIEGPNAGDFEIGSGVYTASGTTLSRTPTESSNSNNAITATTDSVVFVTAAAADLGAAVHSDINGLVAQTGMVVGDTALVTGTNKLYMYTTSGWFLVATMTNTSPSAITGAAASYTLASDGTATVVTLAATDPEGFPITFSHTVSTGSLGSTATVTQGTGANVNVFTVTPSSNSAHAGSFSLTFSASDGNSVSQAISAFSLDFEPSLSSPSYDSKTFDFSTEQYRCTGFLFNSDGSKMYSVGWGSSRVHQFNLSTNFDVSTAAYNSVALFIGGEASRASGMSFNSDGSKLYVINFSNDTAYEYGLTTDYDLSTASYSSSSFTFSAQSLYPQEIAFNADGTKMYILDATNAGVYQYNLTSGFNLSTASYSNISFSVSGQLSFPTGMSFSSSGKTMFIVGNSNDTAYQYNLTSGFDLSTASYSNNSFSVQGQASDPQAVVFNSTDTKMFIANYSGDVYQYSL